MTIMNTSTTVRPAPSQRGAPTRSPNSAHKGEKGYETNYWHLQNPGAIPDVATARACLDYCNLIIGNRQKILRQPGVHKDVISRVSPDLNDMLRKRQALMEIWGRELLSGKNN